MSKNTAVGSEGDEGIGIGSVSNYQHLLHPVSLLQARGHLSGGSEAEWAANKLRKEIHI